jgi:hypothetical protein
MEVTSHKDLATRMVGILWGDAKTGKTTYAASLPGKKLILNYDPDGYMSIANRDDFDVVDMSEMTALEAQKASLQCETLIRDKGDQYDSVIVDSLTTLAEMSLNYAVASGVGKSKTFTPSILSPGLSAYGGRNTTFNDLVTRFLRATSKHKLHLFMLAHTADPERDDAGNAVEQTIMLGDKMRNTSSLKSSEIWHLSQSTSGRTIYLKPFGIKKPMGSRIFDVDKLSSFKLNYDPDLPDEDQPHSLASIYKAWEEGGRKKLTTL